MWLLSWLIFIVWYIGLHSAIVDTKRSHPYPLLYWCMISSSVLECRGSAGSHGHTDLWRTGQMQCVPLWAPWKRGPGLHSIWVILPVYVTAFVRVCFIRSFMSWVMQPAMRMVWSHISLARGLWDSVGIPHFLLLLLLVEGNIICGDLAVKTRMKTLTHRAEVINWGERKAVVWSSMVWQCFPSLTSVRFCL